MYLSPIYLDQVLPGWNSIQVGWELYLMVALLWHCPSAVTTHTLIVSLFPPGIWNFSVSLERTNTGDLETVDTQNKSNLSAKNMCTSTQIFSNTYSFKLQSIKFWKRIFTTSSRFFPFISALFLPWKETSLGHTDRISG